MKGLILLNAYNYSDTMVYQTSRIKEEFNKLGVEIDIKQNNIIPAYIGSNGDVLTSIKKYDFVIFWDKDKHLSYLIEKSGVRLFNNAKSIEICDDKMLTHIELANSGIKMPKTISSPVCYVEKEDDTFFNNMVKEFSFPIVAKHVYGSMGTGVFLIENIKELKRFYLENRYIPHLYQEFIKSSFGFDIRIVCINKKAVAMMKRQSDGSDFRSNIARGGTGIKINPPIEYIETAEKCARVLNLDYCGVDILEGENKEPIVCEVNSNAFFRGIEGVTKVNVAGLYAKHILDEISK